jgi:hypothetical protein
VYNETSRLDGIFCFDPCARNWPRIAAAVNQAGGFTNVSKQAMIIRLQDLGLVINETRSPLAWRESDACC